MLLTDLNFDLSSRGLWRQGLGLIHHLTILRQVRSCCASLCRCSCRSAWKHIIIAIILIFLAGTHVVSYFHTLVVLLILKPREGRDPISLHSYRKSNMTLMLSEGLQPISPFNSLFILASWRWLMLTNVAFILLKITCCRSDKLLLSHIIVNLGNMTWGDRSILNQFVYLVHCVDHAIRCHST